MDTPGSCNRCFYGLHESAKIGDILAQDEGLNKRVMEMLRDRNEIRKSPISVLSTFRIRKSVNYFGSTNDTRNLMSIIGR